MDISFVIKIAGIGLIVAVLSQILTRSGRDEYAMLTVLAGIIVILAMLLPKLAQLYSALSSVFGL